MGNNNFGKNWFQVRHEHDYFSLNSKREIARNFIKRGHILRHVIDRFKWYYGPNLFLVFPFPTHLEIEASNRCQMKCPMCGRHLMKTQKQGDMELGLFKKIIDECSRESVYSVKLSWRGEPLLNPDIVKMVAYAKQKGVRDVAFLTNGERLNNKLTEELIDAGLDWISISIDGLDSTYEKIRYPAKFRDIVEKLKYIRLARERRGREKPIIRVQSIWAAIKKEPKAFYAFWSPIADKVNFISDQKRSSDAKEYRLDPSFICPTPWQRMCIMWDGRVSQCKSDYLEGNILGDVKTQSLKEIWHGDKFNELRALMKKRQRMKLAPCRVCPDGNISRKKIVDVGGKPMEIELYENHDLDVEKLDARPEAARL